MLDELTEPRLRRPPIGLDAQLLFHPAQQRLSRCLQGLEPGLAADGRQGLLQVDPGRRPIARGHGDPGTVEQFSCLLFHERTMTLDQRVLLATPGLAFFRQGQVQLVLQ